MGSSYVKQEKRGRQLSLARECEKREKQEERRGPSEDEATHSSCLSKHCIQNLRQVRQHHNRPPVRRHDVSLGEAALMKTMGDKSASHG